MRSYPCSVCGAQVHASDLCHCEVCASLTCLDCCPIWMLDLRRQDAEDDRRAEWDLEVAGWNADADALTYGTE